MEAYIVNHFEKYDKAKLRIFDIDPAKRDSFNPWREYRRGEPFSDFSPGSGVILITRNDFEFRNGAGITLSTVDTFEITLEPGWNIVGSPFNFEIPVEKVSPTTLTFWLRTSNGYVRATTLQPWEGYLVHNGAESAITLTSDPFEADDSLPPPVALAKGISSVDWSIRIKGAAGPLRDEDNEVGVSPEAADEWDALERQEPPPIAEFISVHFDHRDWQTCPGFGSTDFRPAGRSGYIWEFRVATNLGNETVMLDFENLHSVPEELEIRLQDPDLNQNLDLRQNPQYEYTSGSTGGVKKLKLLVGDVVTSAAGKTPNGIPREFELAQNYPNPFNPSTAIKFALPEAGQVVLKIYNLLGQEVRTLLDGEMRSAGRHAIVWDGRDDFGQTVGSGIYLYQLRAGGQVLTRKMTLLK